VALPYWFVGDLENRLSAEVVLQIFDDDNDGEADAGPIARLQLDSDSFVEGYLRGVFPLEAVRTVKPNQVVRLSLDYAVAQCAKRHPEYVKRDWKALEKAVTDELEQIRMGKVRLDIETSPEPGANQGGEAWDGGSDSSVEPAKSFTCTMGDF